MNPRRKIPVTMATQHPDNAGIALFSGKRFVSSSEEIDECYRCFTELGAHEYMWDWEGKFVDEAVIDRLFQNHYDYFKKNKLGKDLFLTFRVPNVTKEASHRLPRALMNIVSAAHAAKQFGFHTPPLFEVILPMTESVEELTYLHGKFAQIRAATDEIFDTKSSIDHIDVIPLFETLDAMEHVEETLTGYLAYLKKMLGRNPHYLRVFIARSDPAMNLGIIPAIICCKHVIAACHRFTEKTGIPVYPWIGAGSLPFRGGVNPDNVDGVITEYQGAYSLTIQSAFRSDYPLADVKHAIKTLNDKLPKAFAAYKTPATAELGKLITFAKKSVPYFQEVIEAIAPEINRVAALMPNHRERVQHVGLFGYSRGVGKVKLPRAIKFCGALYSLGIPPEFIGTGRALKLARETGMLPLVEKYYTNLRRDLIHAGHYLNKENLELLARKSAAWRAVREDIWLIEDYLGETLGPNKLHHMLHRNFTSNTYFRLTLRKDADAVEDILKAAEIRKSLG